MVRLGCSYGTGPGPGPGPGLSPVDVTRTKSLLGTFGKSAIGRNHVYFPVRGGGALAMSLERMIQSPASKIGSREVSGTKPQGPS